MKLDKFTIAYIECALWSSTLEDGTPMDDSYSIDDIHPAALKSILKDCTQFQNDKCYMLDGLNLEQCGHDFWLTRNGHGAGFWDRGLGPIGEDLTAACKPWGESYLYVDDDGLIHVS